ncbi:flavoprotein, HI0933 family [Opitutaceae bacterium TAV1]|nr:flavoprotein, HI0933 family [Opitutaceae bacterium TAV1]
MSLRVLIVGGGAAGFFAAIRCAEAHPQARVVLYEAGAQPLAKVRISGGGRCNVTHACPEPRELVKRYPRGARELLGPFHKWGPRETIAWFAARGVELKTESDGRMFPVTDDSATIAGCLLRAADDAGVRVFTRMGVRGIVRMPAAATAAADDGARFDVTFSDGSAGEFDRVVLATGGGRGSAGPQIAASLGHTLEPPVPSLFTFHIDDARIRGLEGVAVPDVATSVKDTKLRETGALLVTHWGMSGPAILKLSAWGARELAARDYRFTLGVAWAGAGRTADQVFAELGAARAANPRKQVVTWNPFALPARLWERLVAAAGIPDGAVWTGVSNSLLQALAAQLAGGEFEVEGKSLNKEEFVTCGGVRLREVDFRTMESRVCPGLFFAGELLDIDGVTGGFNFQAAWTTGWLAGTSAATV